jgi:hypothetical protein
MFLRRILKVFIAKIIKIIKVVPYVIAIKRVNGPIYFITLLLEEVADFLKV